MLSRFRDPTKETSSTSHDLRESPRDERPKSRAVIREEYAINWSEGKFEQLGTRQRYYNVMHKVFFSRFPEFMTGCGRPGARAREFQRSPLLGERDKGGGCDDR